MKKYELGKWVVCKSQDLYTLSQERCPTQNHWLVRKCMKNILSHFDGKVFKGQSGLKQMTNEYHLILNKWDDLYVMFSACISGNNYVLDSGYYNWFLAGCKPDV